MKALVATLALLVSLGVHAQDRPTREQTLQKLAHELAEMQSVIDASRGSQFAAYTNAKAKVIDPSATIHADANTSSAVVSKPQVGATVKLLGREGNWYRVEPVEPSPQGTQGWIQAPAIEPYTQAATASYSSDALFQQLTEMATKIRDEYQNNPFIRISGFDVEIGLPPSVTVNFEFKQ